MIDRKKVISFEEEFALVKDYLSLEMTRFEERLQFEYEIDPQVWKHQVPPLMLQTIVENGIKHGIAKRKQGGVIFLRAQIREDSVLCCQVRNHGRYEPREGKEEGYGLRSTRQRLALLYGRAAQFEIRNESDDFVLTQVCIPIYSGAVQHSVHPPILLI